MWMCVCVRDINAHIKRNYFIFRFEMKIKWKKNNHTQWYICTDGRTVNHIARIYWLKQYLHIKSFDEMTNCLCSLAAIRNLSFILRFFVLFHFLKEKISQLVLFFCLSATINSNLVDSDIDNPMGCHRIHRKAAAFLLVSVFVVPYSFIDHRFFIADMLQYPLREWI